MTVVARRAQILVVPDAAVMTIGGRFVVRMALDTLKRREITGNRMTIRAVTPPAAVSSRIDGKILRIMIPGRRCPSVCSMTIRTRGREIGRRVVGISRTVVVRLVTGITIGRCTAVLRCVACHTLERRMLAR